jgi:hypothetical protein
LFAASTSVKARNVWARFIDSTATRATAHRFDHDAGSLIDLKPRLENLRVTEVSTYQGSGRNIFRVVVEQSDRPTVPQRESVEQKSPPSVAPISFPLKYFGFSRNGQTRSIFLLNGSDIFIACEGDIVDRRYKIVRIAHNAAQVEDLLSNQRQELWFKETP